MTVLYNNDQKEQRERNFDALSVISESTTFSNEQPIYSVPTIVTINENHREMRDNDKQSIISSSSSESGRSTSGRKTHSIFPNVKKFIQYNNFENEKDATGETENTTTLFVQKWLDAIAGLDLVLFAISIILAVSTEKYLCYDGPVRLDYSRSIFLSDSLSTDEAAGSPLNAFTVYEYVKDYLLKQRMTYDSPMSYHLLVFALLAIGMAYFVTEIWLFCVLIKIGREKRPANFCMKWIVWRSIILTITLLISFFDVISAHQVTCSEVIVVPFQVVRMFIGGVPVIWVLCNQHSVGKKTGIF